MTIFQSLVSLLLLLLFVSCFVCYNIDELDPIIIKGPVTGEYFGYSLTFQSVGDRSWLLVGAPLANITRSNNTLGLRWGTVYNCTLDKKCTKIILDIEPEKSNEEKNGMWSGGALAYSEVTKSVVTCAHRYVSKGHLSGSRNVAELGIRGKCWKISPEGTVQTLPPLCQPQDDPNTDRCSAGTSVTYFGDLIGVGGAGYNMWAGTFLFYNTVNGRISTSKGYDNKVDSYLGYSSASCYDPNGEYIYYFEGATRARGCAGKVDMVRFKRNGLFYGTGRLAVGSKNKLVGSNFGFSVTCGNFAKDKIQVVVGAPTYSSNYNDLLHGGFIGSDRGAVYVYQISPNFPNAAFPMKRLYGERAGDRFGYSVSVIGDVNKDGYDDLAVGAPSELQPGEGVVYIYLGSVRGISDKYFQKIKSQPAVYGFGSSVYGGVDVDNNGFVDLVIGSYHSDVALIYRSLPIINIIVNSTAPQVIDKSDICPGSQVACFELQYCISYIAGDKIEHLENVTFGISIELELDIYNEKYEKRVHYDTGGFLFNTTVYIQYGQSTVLCNKKTVYLMEVLTSIKELIAIEARIDNIKSDTFEKRTSLNATEITEYLSLVRIKTECGNATCLSDLTLTSSVQFDGLEGDAPRHDVIYAGYNKILTAVISTHRNNSFGKPYGSHLIITMPDSVFIESVKNTEGAKLGLCNPYGTLVGSYYCELDNALDMNDTDTFNFTIEFSVVGLNGEEKEMLITMKLLSDSADEQNPKNNEVQHLIQVRKLSKLQLNGTASPSTATFQIEKDPPPFGRYVEEVGKEQHFSFLLSNMGPSAVHNVKLIIEIPAFLNNTLDQDFLYPYIVESSSILECEDHDVNIKNFKSKSSKTRTVLKSSHQSSLLEEINDSIRGTMGNTTNGEFTPYVCGELADCVNISCTVINVREKQLTALRLRTYIWSRTFIEAQNISTKVRGWLINNDHTVDLTTSSFLGPLSIPLKIKVVTQLRRTVNIWIIIGSASGGLLLLSTIILILYKIGFFKRKRPDKSEFYANKNKSDKTPVMNVHESFCESEGSYEDGVLAFHNPMAQIEDVGKT